MSLRILWVKSGPLYPIDTGGKKRSHAMLCELSKSNEVTYLALAPAGADGVSLEEESATYAAEKVWVPSGATSKSGLGLVAALAKNQLLTSFPFSLERYRSPALDKKLRTISTPDRFDLAICDFLTPSPAFLTFGNSGCPVPTILFQHNMEAQIWHRLAAGKTNPLSRFYFRSQAKRMARWERRLSALFDGVVTVSPEDTAHARDAYGLQNVLGHVPTGVSSDYFSKVGPAVDGNTAGFLGSMDWMPNVEAVLWFADAILPRIRKIIPDFRLSIIGRNPTQAILRLADSDPGIEVTGTVPDVRPHLGKCSALVVPLRSGGGTRIKIMESLAAGIPVVSTSVGAEGLGLVNGKHVMLADEPNEFARSVCDLLADPQKRHQLSVSGRQLVRDAHGWEGVTQKFLQLCSAVLKNSAAP